MKLDDIRHFCLSLPAATEGVQWGNDLLFRIHGKMFCVACLEPDAARVKMSFKCSPDGFAELTEREGIVPAPYLARYHWVGIERYDALPPEEMRRLIRQSYEMIAAKAPKKRATAAPRAPRKASATKRGGKRVRAR